MSIEEVKMNWDSQEDEPMGSETARRWIDKERRSYLGITAIVTFSLVVGVACIVLKTIQLIHDPRFSLIASPIDALLGAAPLIGALFGLRDYVKRRREFSALGDDAVRCLDKLIETTRKELRDMKKAGPIICSSIILLVCLAKWETINSGAESVGNALGVIAFVIVMFILVCAAYYHRANQFLIPRLKSLEEARRSFE